MPEITKQIINTKSFDIFEVNALDSMYPIEIPQKNIKGIMVFFSLDFHKRI